jgi:hypothetical protein
MKGRRTGLLFIAEANRSGTIEMFLAEQGCRGYAD